MQMQQYDIKNAFLNGKWSETIYLKQPQGYEVRGKEELALKLNRSTYGLKQSVNVWNKCIADKSRVWTTIKVRLTMYNEGKRSYITIYVDDIIIAANNTNDIIEFEKMLLNSY